MAFINDLRSSIRRTGAPVTVLFIAGIVFVALFGWLARTGAEPFLYSISFDTGWINHPWSLLTYPFAFAALGPGLSLLGFVFTLLWLFWIGGTVERDLGGNRYASLCALLTVIGGLSVWLASSIVGVPVQMEGPMLPLAALTVIWATRYPTTTVMLMFIIPVQAKWIGMFSAAGVLLGYGVRSPLVGLFAMIPVALAFAFASNRLGKLRYGRVAVSAPNRASKAQERQDAQYFEDVRRREQARAERERLRKLFESSLDDEAK